MIHSEMSWEMPRRAKAKLSVKAAMTMSMIMDEVRTVEMMASSSIRYTARNAWPQLE